METDGLIAHCESLALELGRLGAFVEMSYRLFPNTRNSFTPNLLELGFNFEEIRQVTAHTALRFQVFPSAFVTPIKKELEELRSELKSLDQGPFTDMGAPFLSHHDLSQFREQIMSERARIQRLLHKAMIDNYDQLRAQAYDSLRATFETLLPRLGISNTSAILSGQSWFGQVFPNKATLTGDFRLDISMFNVHPNALLSSSALRGEVERFLVRPRQLSLFEQDASDTKHDNAR